MKRRNVVEELQALCDIHEIAFVMMGRHYPCEIGPGHEDGFLVRVIFTPHKPIRVMIPTRDHARTYWKAYVGTPLSAYCVRHWFVNHIYTSHRDWKRDLYTEITNMLVTWGYEENPTRRLDRLVRGGILRGSAVLADLLTGRKFA